MYNNSTNDCYNIIVKLSIIVQKKEKNPRHLFRHSWSKIWLTITKKEAALVVFFCQLGVFETSFKHLHSVQIGQPLLFFFVNQSRTNWTTLSCLFKGDGWNSQNCVFDNKWQIFYNNIPLTRLHICVCPYDTTTTTTTKIENHKAIRC